MENATQVPKKPDDGYGYIWIYVIWICYGSIALGNLLVAATIIRYKALRRRKEYVTMCGLCIADFLQISTMPCYAVHRLFLIYTGEWSVKRSIWHCVILPHNVLYWFSMPLASLMLSVLSCDRLVAVAAPVKYFKTKRNQVMRAVASVYGLCLVSCLLLIGLGVGHMTDGSTPMHAGCFTGATVVAATNWYYALYFLYVQPTSALLSVVLYVFVGVIYFKKKATVVDSGQVDSVQARDRKRQRKLTESIAVSCLCTVLFLLIPLLLVNTGDSLFKLPRLFHQIIWLFPYCNPMCNVIIYVKRQKDIRKGC